MFQHLFLIFARFVLSLRYRIILKNSIPDLKGGGVLFLPNHMALMDPVIMTDLLYSKYKIRPLADDMQIDLPIFGPIIKGFRPITIPNLEKSGNKKEQVVESINKVIKALQNKDNILLYPGGRLYRSNKEDLRSNSSIELILKNVPDVQIVLVRMTGFWGSQFSWAKGINPKIFTQFWKHPLYLLLNGIFFMPKRLVTLEFTTLPEEFPKAGSRQEINRWLENYYNAIPAYNTFVPHFWWQGSKPQILPEITRKEVNIDISDVSSEIIEKITAKLSEVTGIKNISPQSNLSQDLGMDSLALAEVLSWVGTEYQITIESLDGINTVADIILIACGQSTKKVVEKISAPEKWFGRALTETLFVNEGKTVPQIFLERMRQDPSYVLIADEMSGVKTHRELLVGIKLLSKVISKFPEENIGIMLPASVACTTLFSATHFAHKTPVMVNWTVGSSILKDSLDSVNVKTILTSKKMVEKLKATGFDLSTLPYHWVFLEDVAKKFTLPLKLAALISTYLPWSPLHAPKDIKKTAVILFTSGSEAKPKAVPLTHENLVSNACFALKKAKLPGDTTLLGMLPPFHSMGLLSGVLLASVSGLRTIYHANPNESAIIAELIERYKINLFIGTPTFANGVLRVASKEQLKTLRFAVMGAEKCPDYVAKKFQDLCPRAYIVEGYGITECSPLVTLNPLTAPVLGSLGEILDNLEYRIVHPETYTKIPKGEVGLLLVRGKSIFQGYLNKTASSPFLQFEGKEWYNTGDLVKDDPRGVLVFAGRLKRFVKLGGEMISLVALEDVLTNVFPNDNDGPVVAVEASNPDVNPELVLFSKKALARDEVNTIIRQAGLSGLYSIKHVIQIPEIPVLGTGKTDYKQLRQLANQRP